MITSNEKGMLFEAIFKQMVIMYSEELNIDSKKCYPANKVAYLFTLGDLKRDENLRAIANSLNIGESIMYLPTNLHEPYFDCYCFKKVNSIEFEVDLIQLTVNKSHKIVTLEELSLCNNYLECLSRIDMPVKINKIFVTYITSKFEGKQKFFLLIHQIV